jgi:hypothetical protein
MKLKIKVTTEFTKKIKENKVLVKILYQEQDKLVLEAKVVVALQMKTKIY